MVGFLFGERESGEKVGEEWRTVEMSEYAAMSGLVFLPRQMPQRY